METPVETFGFRSQIEEMGFNTPASGWRGGFQRLRLMPPTPKDLGLENFEILRLET